MQDVLTHGYTAARVQPDDKDPWYFSRNHSPPQIATWGEIKRMVRSKRLRADDLLMPVPPSSPGASPGTRDHSQELAALSGIWRTAEEVFQNLPYEEMPVPSPNRRTAKRLLWMLPVVGCAIGLGFWYESTHRSSAQKKTATNTDSASPEVTSESRPLPVPASANLVEAMPALSLLPPEPAAIPPAPLDPSLRDAKSNHLIIPPELLQFQRYDQPRPPADAPRPAAATALPTP